MKKDPTRYRMRFGKHEGKTLFEIAEEDPTYLDWAVDEANDAAVRKIIAKALTHPDIARRVDAAMEEKAREASPSLRRNGVLRSKYDDHMFPGDATLH